MSTKNKFHQTSDFAVLSISYEKADAETRGRFAFFDDHIKAFVNQIHEQDYGDAFVVSTCNRTEIYSTTKNYLHIAELYCNTVGVSLSEFLNYVNVLQREDALYHLFRVAAGLESQIIGDFEIVSQIKNAYHRFKTYKDFSNPYLERAINSSIQISKRIKNETGISTGSASVSYAAVHYILNNTKHIHEKNILLLGVGEIGQNTIENLVKHIYQPNIKIANRSFEKAEKIADKYNIPQIDFDTFPEELKKTDVLIVATGAQKYIVNQDNFPKEKEMLVIDLSIPNNVQKEIGNLENVTLIDVDQLSQTIKATMDQRKKEIPKAEAIIKDMAKEFVDWEKKRKLAPQINHFKNSLKRIEEIEMHNIHKKFHYAKIEDMELSNNLVQKITNRFAKYIMENPSRADEITKLMEEILDIHKQENNDDNKNRNAK
ncbi:glutamyl-tRNA reductase [Epilithonimonas tenax]|uniref:glutamyl-tRNA reductase n=1 Tax=Epilithonimonas tenax TaxID=191577 RepID=UPI000428F4A1|nr:glutamyl-tRNA reductase [Epilithonimonas tenax]